MSVVQARQQRGGAPRVLIVSGSVGAGHDGAARELAARVTEAGAAVAVRDLLDAVPGWVAWALREGYSQSVNRLPIAFELLFRRLERRGLLWYVEEAVCAWAESAVLAWAEDFGADVVVSTYPLASQTIGALRADGRLTAQAVTYLTDPAVHISWLHPGIDRYLTVTSATAEHGRAAYGTQMDVGGPLVPARFARPLDPEQVAALRRELTPDAGRPAALLVAGSLGLGDIAATVDDVTAAGFTAVVVCGRNDRLRGRVRGISGAVALGWRDDMHRLMQAVDVLVQNAGGLSFTEALVAGLPAVTYRPIPGHGRANARILDEGGLAPWARSAVDLSRLLHAQSAGERAWTRFPDPTDALLGEFVAAVPMDHVA